jgi:hypothetical protein
VADAGGMNRLKAAAPAGAAALAIVAAIAGGSLLTSQPKAPGPLPAGGVVEAPAAPAPASSAPAPSDPAISPQAATPQPGGAVPGVAFDQVPGVSAPQLGMEIVVKFKDDAKIKDIVDSFWKDQGTARTKFDAFKARRPEFANLKLDRVTYSNELVLVHDGRAPADQRLTAMRTVAAKLKNVGDISYAEPNMTAQPGGQ